MGVLGNFVWGDGTLWGAQLGIYPHVNYGVLVDWNNDGIYDGNEARYMLSWSTERGRDFFLNSSSDGLEPVNEGRMTITLDNSSGRFDTFNTLGALYPNILPGRKIQFIVQDSSTLTNHTVFTGEIEDIRPFAQEQTVQITAVDFIRKLAAQDTTVALNSSIKVSDAVEAILDSVSFTDYDVDGILDVVSYWWVNQQKVTDAIQELCDASFGTFFIAADGKAKYYKRQRAVASVLNLTQDVLQKDIGINQPWDVIRNNIDVIVHPIVRQATGNLWTLRDKPTVAAGATVEIWGEYTYNNIASPATGVIDPVATTDYAMNTAENGSGTNLTASFTVTADKFGESAKLTITNNSASLGYITLLKIRGDALTSPDLVRVNAIDTASAGIYGNRTFRLDSRWMQNTNIGLDLSETIKNLLSSARKYPVIKIDTRPDIQYTADLFDRISLIISSLGVDGAFKIGKIKHESSSASGQSVTTTLIVEPIVEVSDVYWEFPTEIGVTSIFA